MKFQIGDVLRDEDIINVQHVVVVVGFELAERWSPAKYKLFNLKSFSFRNSGTIWTVDAGYIESWFRLVVDE